MDRRDEAGQALGDALIVARRILYPPVAWRSLGLLGELARRSGDARASSRHFMQASALVEQKAQTLTEPEHRRALRTMGQRLAVDPLSALR